VRLLDGIRLEYLNLTVETKHPDAPDVGGICWLGMLDIGDVAYVGMSVCWRF